MMSAMIFITRELYLKENSLQLMHVISRSVIVPLRSSSLGLNLHQDRVKYQEVPSDTSFKYYFDCEWKIVWIFSVFQCSLPVLL